jgi:hypothetical protein
MTGRLPDAPVSREELRNLLNSWQRGAVTERIVHEQGEELLARYVEGDLPDYPEQDPRSVAFEAVFQLENLPVQLVTPDDVPAFLEFLAAPAGAEEAAWTKWKSYWDRMDYARRAQELSSNPYYTPILPRDSRSK